MKKILVTGGAGFIGSSLCRELLSKGHEVVCMDNFYSGTLENIQDLFPLEGFSFINHDIREPYSVPCDELYNLACPASPPFYQKDPIFTSETCFLGVRNALENAKKWGASILQASTSEVYGDSQITPQPEEYLGNVNPNGIRSCYDEGKRVAESLCMDYHRLYGVNTHIVRIFNTYGEFMRLDDGRVITQVIKSVITGEAFPMYGSGGQTRSFQYISDLLRGIIALQESSEHSPVNLGNPEEITIRELIDVFSEILGKEIKVEHKDLPQDDPKRRCPDITKATRILGWRPEVSLREGLRAMINHYKL